MANGQSGTKIVFLALAFVRPANIALSEPNDIFLRVTRPGDCRPCRMRPTVFIFDPESFSDTVYQYVRVPATDFTFLPVLFQISGAPALNRTKKGGQSMANRERKREEGEEGGGGGGKKKNAKRQWKSAEKRSKCSPLSLNRGIRSLPFATIRPDRYLIVLRYCRI